MARKKNKKGGRSGKDESARRHLEQLKLQKTLRSFVRQLVDTPAVINHDTIFKALVAEFKEKFETSDDCREEIIRLVNLKTPILCECGHNGFKRDYGKSKAKCLNCKKSQSILASVNYFRSMREPRLVLAMVWMKERCAFFSIKQFAEAFGFAYSSCWLQAKKVELILLTYTAKFKAVEEVDSARFENCFHKRSSKTPIDSEPAAEQFVADEKYYSGTQPIISENGIRRMDVSHLAPDQQTVYGLLSNQPKHIDDLNEASNLSDVQFFNAITALELNALVVRLAGHNWILAGHADEVKPEDDERAAKALKKPLRILNHSHRATAATIAPLLTLSNHGFSRKYLPLYIVEFWRATQLLLKGEPLRLFDHLVEISQMNKSDVLDFDCPLLIRIPTAA